MSDMIQNQYQPDYAVTPGEILLETIDALGMSQAELADRTGRPKKTINAIIKGKAAIMPDTALQFERVLGVPASFWNNLERQYQETQARLADRPRLIQQTPWLKVVPIKDMVKHGWISEPDNAVELLEVVLRFFGIASPEQWETVWSNASPAFRQSRAFQNNPVAVAAWLRQGEIEAQEISCGPYDEAAFRRALTDIRGMTREEPDVSLPKAERLCAEAGVAVVFVPELPKTHVSGATRWLTPTKALIQLSLRYKTDDHMWFTFFHEAGHILLHGKRQAFLEDNESDQKEHEADRFASNFLIPPADLRRFVATHASASKVIAVAAIQQFAAELAITPGIVVGRLQHDGYLLHSHSNDLKRRLAWASTEESQPAEC